MLGVHHPLVKSIRKAVQRGARTEEGFAVAEGPNLLQEALRSGTKIEAIVATRRTAESLVTELPVHLVEEPTMAQLSSVEAHQGVVSLLAIEESALELTLATPALAVALDEIQDPGNAGTIARAAEAFGATGLIFLKGSVSPWNPKTLRASAGSLLRLPFALATWDDFHQHIQTRKIPLYAAHPRAEKRIDQIPFAGPAAILIGNEGRGIPANHADAATPVRIPTQGVESLNAALAAGILLYEARRQRS